ncbi:MAG: hypothetical protein JNL66_15275 [Alphaproteobacteria bacterium]|nr:hypothetical protein [Alphaproteobacteria bacterium]
MRPSPSSLRFTILPRVGAVALAAWMIVVGGPGRAAPAFESMDALSRAAYAAMAAEMCDRIIPTAETRLAVAERVAADTGASLDSVLTSFHNLRMVALMDISEEGCDSPNVAAMRAHYGRVAGMGGAGAPVNNE